MVSKEGMGEIVRLPLRLRAVLGILEGTAIIPALLMSP